MHPWLACNLSCLSLLSVNSPEIYHRALEKPNIFNNEFQHLLLNMFSVHLFLLCELLCLFPIFSISLFIYFY